ncbi:hypothetical protein AVEN_68859-1 [Araneus ventricosus]|uniref:Uncharacterized protein n=1 Tax=Araneus ventricosus TaxID=182803 RepID=A0A4Y2C561_ARAVE|nr:hypothetical protein AVEN_68859-1 [Araneus ventricosus]
MESIPLLVISRDPALNASRTDLRSFDGRSVTAGSKAGCWISTDGLGDSSSLCAPIFDDHFRLKLSSTKLLLNQFSSSVRFLFSTLIRFQGSGSS